MTPESVVTPTTDVSTTPESGASTATDSSSVSQGASSAPAQTASGVTADVQGATTEADPLAGVPSLDELNQLPDTAQYKKSLIQLRNAYETLRPQFDDLAQRVTPFQPFIDRFESPDNLQRVVELQDSLIGWENDPQTGEPIPAVEKGVQQ